MQLGIGIVTSHEDIFSRRWDEVGHSAPLFTKIDFVISQVGLGASDIDLLSVISGPGSFTGLRIGMAGLLGWAVSLRLPIQPVDMFVAMRASVPKSLYPLLVVILSRGKEFYAQYAASPDEKNLFDPIVGSVDSVADLPDAECRVCGPGSAAFFEQLEDKRKDQFKPSGKEFFVPDMTVVCKKAESLYADRNDRLENYRIEPYYMTLSQAELKFKSRERKI